MIRIWMRSLTWTCAFIVVPIIAASEESTSIATSSTSSPHEGLAITSSPETCQSCHSEIYDQWKVSFHAKATTSPAFRGMFTIFDYNTGGGYAEECLNCHATDVKLTGAYEPLRDAILRDEPDTPGVTCTACHAIRNVEDVPDLLVPAELEEIKATPFHNVNRSELFKKEVFCSACHDYNNSHAADGQWELGIACCDVSRDFRDTKMAERGVTCQTCHMAPGLENDPNAWKSALGGQGNFKDRLLDLLNLGRYVENKLLPNHRFLGSHDPAFTRTAVIASLEVQEKGSDEIVAQVSIENLTGHSMPNGCPPRARIFLRVWLEDDDGFEIAGRQVEYGFNFVDREGFEPAMVDAAVGRGFDHVLEAESIDRTEHAFALSDDESVAVVKASLTYVHFVMPPSEAQNRMQQGIIKRIEAASPKEKEFILNTEIPGRMGAMNRLASAYPPIVMWSAQKEISAEATH